MFTYNSILAEMDNIKALSIDIDNELEQLEKQASKEEKAFGDVDGNLLETIHNAKLTINDFETIWKTLEKLSGFYDFYSAYFNAVDNYEE